MLNIMSVSARFVISLIFRYLLLLLLSSSLGSYLGGALVATLAVPW